MSVKRLKNLKVIASGFAAGLINGLLGAGGGMVAVPILGSMLKDRKKIHASSVAVIMPLSLMSVLMYIFSGDVTLSAVLPYLPTGLLGAALGTFVLSKLPDKILKKIFALFMIWAGVRLFLK